MSIAASSRNIRITRCSTCASSTEFTGMGSWTAIQSRSAASISSNASSLSIIVQSTASQSPDAIAIAV